MNPDKKLGVVLFQLGGPDSLDAVEPFLYNLFCDPDIIDFPGAFLARRALARFISKRRSKKVIEHYREIGGKSPIVDLTKAQAVALERALNLTRPARVVIAMRYWHPDTSEAIAQLRKEGCTSIVLLPLYPQFSKATTLSSLKEWNRVCTSEKFEPTRSASVCCYHSHPLYIEAIVENINIAYRKFSHLDPAGVELVFSAHGVPVSLINEGDPYQVQIEETVRLTMARGQWKSPHRLCFQSKVGPAQWLKPSLDETIAALAREGRHHLLVIPVAFVTEHIETLHEINIEAREEALHLGIVQFEMMPALNDHPRFIACLTDLVLKLADGKSPGMPACRNLPSRIARDAKTTLCPLWNTGSE